MIDGVAGLYDALHAFESRFRRGAAYPVHKNLKFSDPEIADIYDWIITGVGLPDGGAILDAGCGVGFGTIRMANRSSSQVTGISISPAEIATATRTAAESMAGNRLAFAVGSFDQPLAGPFALITAVESLKHSADLATTLNMLFAALQPGGTIVIVDDCYSGPADDEDAVQLCEAWKLVKLYSESDFSAWPDSVHCDVISLDECLAFKTALSRTRRRLGSLLRPLFSASIPSPVAAAFRGGRCLERLYGRGLMQYTAIIAHYKGVANHL